MSKASDLQKHTYEAPGNTTGFVSVPERAIKGRKLLSELPPGKVLDVGCGDGFIVKPLVGHHDVHGVDISEIAVAQANAAGVKARQHDLEEPLPYENATFDAVFCGETIEHQVDTDWLLSEINRVLKPGGVLVLTYPNIRTLLGIFMLTFLDMPPMYAARYRAPHYRDFTYRTVKIALHNNGFRLDKAWGCAFFVPGPGGGKERGSKLASFLPRFASSVILRAVKFADAKYRMEDVIGQLY